MPDNQAVEDALRGLGEVAYIATDQADLLAQIQQRRGCSRRTAYRQLRSWQEDGGMIVRLVVIREDQNNAQT